MREHGCTTTYLNSITLMEICLYFTKSQEIDPQTAEDHRLCFLKLNPAQRVELGLRKLREL